MKGPTYGLGFVVFDAGSQASGLGVTRPPGRSGGRAGRLMAGAGRWPRKTSEATGRTSMAMARYPLCAPTGRAVQGAVSVSKVKQYPPFCFPGKKSALAEAGQRPQ